MPLGMGAGIGRGGDAVEHAPRAGVVADQVDLARAEPGIDHHRPGFGRRDGQDQGGLGDAVLRHHHDPVAGPDALLPQPAAQDGDVPGELGIGPGPVRLGQRGRVRRALGPGLDRLVEPRRQGRHGRSEPVLEGSGGSLVCHASRTRVLFLN